MQNYPWPGNIRELENVLTRAVALAGGAQLGVRDLPAKLVKTTFVTDKISLALSEKETLETALAAATGNRKEAARILGLSEATLYRKLKKAGTLKSERLTGCHSHFCKSGSGLWTGNCSVISRLCFCKLPIFLSSSGFFGKYSWIGLNLADVWRKII